MSIVNYQYKNSKNRKLSRKRNNKKVALTAFSLLFLGIVGFFVLNRYWLSKNPKPQSTQEAATTSTSPSAQDDYSDGDERQAQDENLDQGTATIKDNRGSISETPVQSKWTTSSTGQITLYSPNQNELLKNGDFITGESTLSVVSFRIIDDVSGVISTGQLSVIKGKFSGNISFSTSASTGRLDIYATKDDGAEFSNIEVPVRFK